MSRRKPKPSECRTIPDFVRAGILRPVQPTTASGWTRYGTGREFLPAATNYCTRPSFEVGAADALATGWVADRTAAAYPTYSKPAGRTGGVAQRFQLTSSGDEDKGINVGFSADAATWEGAEAGRFSFYAKGSVSGCVLSASVYDHAWTTLVGPTVITLANDWTRHSLSFTGAAESTSVRVYFRFTSIDNGDTIDVTVDDVLIEKSATPSPYFDGSYADCAWTGTADASTSTRTVSALTVPVALSNTAWTVAGRYTAPWAHNDSLAHNLLTLYAASDARAAVYKHTDQKLYASVNDGVDTVTSASAASTLAANTVNTFVARSTWAATVNLMLNGVASTQGDASAVAAQAITALTIGGTPNGSIGPLVVSATDKGATWATNISAAGFSDIPRLVRDFMAVGDFIIPLGGDSTAYRRVT